MSRFERLVIAILQWLLMLVIALALFELCALLLRAIAATMFAESDSPIIVGSVPELQRYVQRAFAGVLLIILGLELLDTLKSYFTEHRVRVEVILIVAIIALGRHIIQLDLEHLEPITLIGVGVLTLALTAGYFLIKRALATSGQAGGMRAEQ